MKIVGIGIAISRVEIRSNNMKNLLLTALIAMPLTATNITNAGSLIAIEQSQNAKSGQFKKEDRKSRIDTEKSGSLAKSTTIRKDMKWYVIKQGDSLSEISIKFLGSQEKLRVLVDANNIRDPNEIRIGQRLLIPLKSDKDYYQVGNASWYGADFQGRKTASGKRFNMHNYTAAHRTLPMGTKVRVINLKNGRVVIVKINDRGPYIKGRIIDLSYAAAKSLEMIRSGVTRVKVEVISAPV